MPNGFTDWISYIKTRFPQWWAQYGRPIYRELPVPMTYYWKTPEEKRAELMEEAGIPPAPLEPPRPITMRAVKPGELGGEPLPSVPSIEQLRTRVTPGERFVGEWAAPIAALGLGQIPTATAAWAATRGLPTAAKIAARVPLAPFYGLERALGYPFRAIGQLVKPKLPKVALEAPPVEAAVAAKAPALLPEEIARRQPTFQKVWELMEKPDRMAWLKANALPIDDVVKGWAEVSADTRNVLVAKATQYISFPVAPDLPVGGRAIVEKLINLVEAAKPIRAKTEELYHKIWQKRVAVAARIMEKGEGREAIQASKGALKGELPKAVFTPPAEGLQPSEGAGLYNIIRTIDRRYFTRLDAGDGMDKLLSGITPTRTEMAALEDVFGKRLVEALAQKRPLSSKVWQGLMDVLNLPKAVIASWDLSAGLRQNVFFFFRNPKRALWAYGKGVRMALSQDYLEASEVAGSMSRYADWMVRDGLYQSPIPGIKMVPTVSPLEETFMSRLAQWIPGVRHSARAYIGMLNWIRRSVYSYHAAKFEQNPQIPPRAYKQLATLVNWGTGRGPIGGLAEMVPTLNAIFFAVRLQTSRIALSPPIALMKFTEPTVRRIYLQSMASMIGGFGSILAMLKLSGVADVELNPLSVDFGQIRVGNTRIDPWGGFRPYVVATARLITGLTKTQQGRIEKISRGELLERFFRTKQAPVFAAVYDILKGDTFLGDQLQMTAESVKEQLYNRLTPFVMQGLIDATREEGLWPGALLGSPEFLGMGVVSYPGSLDWLEEHVKDLPPEMLMDWQRQLAAVKWPLEYRDLNFLQQAWLRDQRKAAGMEEERQYTGKSYYAAEMRVADRAREEYHEKLNTIADHTLKGQMTLAEYIDQADKTWGDYYGRDSYWWREEMRKELDPLVWENLERRRETETKPEDQAYETYQEMRANPPTIGGLEYGPPDWDAWEARLEEYLNSLPRGFPEYIEARRQRFIADLPEPAQRLARLQLDCEQILDYYYDLEIGAQRMTARQRFPQVEARLFLLGRATQMQSIEPTIKHIRALMKTYRIPTLLLQRPPEKPVTPPRKRVPVIGGR